jgi:deoxycytidylate deaminase
MELNPKDAELIVGLVARIGVDTGGIVQTIRTELEQYKYIVHEIKVTNLLDAFSDHLNLIKTPREKRYFSYIKACNTFRSKFQSNIMAMLAVMEISTRRSESNPPSDAQSRTAYIVNQIKRPEEFDLLRKVYGEHYVQLSCHSDKDVRISRLQKLIAEDHPEDPKKPQWDIEARQLVHMDESQEDEPDGQRVRQVFPLSDVIIDANSTLSSREGIERFIRALFGDPRVTPTRQEYGMELANTASQRSSDMSRQVGAAILNRHMEIQALGCNEVPSPAGGTYWEGDEGDSREFTLGHDSNESRRDAVLVDLLLRLGRAGALREHLNGPDDIKSFLKSRSDRVISDSQLMDSLEYGRSVHAEMNAITDAARGGHPIRDCILFSNTFPCHNCAKHIVASGISEVVFNHPYPKSYAEELFSDSIAVNPPKGDWTNIEQRKVIFRQFLGIVGPMYSRVFTKARWKKEDGKVTDFRKETGSFVRRTPIPAYIDIEKVLLDELNKNLQSQNFLPTSSDNVSSTEPP